MKTNLLLTIAAALFISAVGATYTDYAALPALLGIAGYCSIILAIIARAQGHSA